MAFQKTLTTEQGIALNYHRIIQIDYDLIANTVACTLANYVSKEVHDQVQSKDEHGNTVGIDGPRAFVQTQYVAFPAPTDIPTDGRTIPQDIADWAYAAFRVAIPFWADAVDVA